MIMIYYAEDDKAIAQTVKEYLESLDCRVSIFSWLMEIRQALQREQPDICLIDWNMPDGAGDEFCLWLRARWTNLPVIFLTVRGDSRDVVSGLGSGGDDYIVKPFELDVLYARISALLRRRRAEEETQFCETQFHCDNLTLDTKRMSVFYQGEEVALSRPEYQILQLLLQNKGTTITRRQLLEQVWDNNGNFVNDNTLTVTMKRIREKLGNPACLKTVRSFGYRMEDTL